MSLRLKEYDDKGLSAPCRPRRCPSLLPDRMGRQAETKGGRNRHRTAAVPLWLHPATEEAGAAQRRESHRKKVVA